MIICIKFYYWCISGNHREEQIFIDDNLTIADLIQRMGNTDNFRRNILSVFPNPKKLLKDCHLDNQTLLIVFHAFPDLVDTIRGCQLLDAIKEKEAFIRHIFQRENNEGMLANEEYTKLFQKVHRMTDTITYLQSVAYEQEIRGERVLHPSVNLYEYTKSLLEQKGVTYLE